MPSLLVNTVNLNRRSYNADDPRDGPFGRSWTSNWNLFLSENPDGSIDTRRESGGIDHFVRGADGKYVPPDGVYDTLSKNPRAGDFIHMLANWGQRTRLFGAHVLLNWG